MKEIQFRGHCPHCVREQAVIRGGMAKHGYTVEFGYFNGTCTGADKPPIEHYPLGARVRAKELREIAANEDDKANRMAARESDPPGAKVTVKEGFTFTRKFIPYAELDERHREAARQAAVMTFQRAARELRQMAKVLDEAVTKYGDKELIEVKLVDNAKAIKVGDRVKVCGKEVEVTKIAAKEARGVGYRINGQYIDHVFWQDGDKERAYPKRYARKVG